jgi:hypothetical protein
MCAYSPDNPESDGEFDLSDEDREMVEHVLQEVTEVVDGKAEQTTFFLKRAPDHQADLREVILQRLCDEVFMSDIRPSLSVSAAPCQFAITDNIKSAVGFSFDRDQMPATLRTTELVRNRRQVKIQEVEFPVTIRGDEPVIGLVHLFRVSADALKPSLLDFRPTNSTSTRYF